MRVRISLPLHLMLLLSLGLVSTTRGQPRPPTESPASLRPPPSAVPARTKVIASPERIILQKSLLSPAGAVYGMKLLSANEGWAVTSGPSLRSLMTQHLWWTTNGGMEWKDITPPISRGAVMGSVFFLDSRRGWALLEQGEPDIPGGMQFQLASTDNGGATWSVRHVTVPAIKYPGSAILHGGILAFADSVHGWLGLGASLSAAFRGTGVLLATSDGGATWKLSTTTGWDKFDRIGPMLWLTPREGWMVSGGGNELLLVTRDGGRTWQRIDLRPPVETEQMRDQKRRRERLRRSLEGSARPADAKRAARIPPYTPPAMYELPTFTHPRHGYVSVAYPGVTVLFETGDSGLTWKPDALLQGRGAGPFVVANSTWISAKIPPEDPPELRKLAPGGRAVENREESGTYLPPLQIDFTTIRQGWLRSTNGELLSTTDAGATWTDITPGRPPHAVGR